MTGWTADAVVTMLRRWARENGRRPTWGDWRRTPPGMPPRSAIERHFGSWRAAMAAAGFEDRGPGAYPRSDRSGDDCANPNCDRKVGTGSRGRCQRCYHHLRRHGGEEWRDRTEELREDICELVRELAGELGRPPSYAEFVAAARRTVGVPRHPERLFGGKWGAVVEAAGFEWPGHGFAAPSHPLFRRREGVGSGQARGAADGGLRPVERGGAG